MLLWSLYNLATGTEFESRLLKLLLSLNVLGYKYTAKKLIRRIVLREPILDFNDIINIIKTKYQLKIDKVGEGYRIYWFEGDYVTVRNIAELILVSMAHNFAFKVVDRDVANHCLSVLNDRCIVFHGDAIEYDGIRVPRRPIRGCPTCLVETFVVKIHDVVKPEGMKVLDIGAWIGDSTLRFAKLGASRVIAVEPNSNNYNGLMTSIKMNPHLGNKIIPLHAAVGEDGIVEICYDNAYSGGGTFLKSKDSKICERVHSYSIKSLIRKYGPFDIIKLDCKGCEVRVIEDIESIKEKPKILKLEIDLITWGQLIHNNPLVIINKLKDMGYNVQTYTTFPGLSYANVMQVVAMLK